jgi:hypothetical protein
MKKLTTNLGFLVLTIGFCLITHNSNSQDSKLTRQEQKEAKRAEMYSNYQVLDTLLERKKFVLKADFLNNQYGNRIHVIPTLNFVKVDASNAVLQIGSNNNLGYNGVGGITAEGKLDSWKLVKDSKNLSYYIQFSAVTNIGVYDVSMIISADKSALATITGLRGGMLIYDGHLETINNSAVYKGQTTY